MRSGDDEAVASVGAELRRIDFTGTVWFAAGLVFLALIVMGALVGDWRPATLPVGLRIVWWTGAVLLTVAVALFAWAGCPVLRTEVARSDRGKAVAVRVGVVGFLAGAVSLGLATFLS